MTTTIQAAGESEFAALADPYRRELLAHCYRMLGSVHDAEDLLQETYLRAWRAYERFENRSSLRTWLYRIATNTCLSALEGKARRPLPTGLGAPGSEPGDELVHSDEIPWLEPAPDASLGVDDPASAATERESIRLAFIAALQYLPPRQRAVLVLRDVLGWRAAEVAAALEVSSAAVNSLLQRARAQLEQAAPDRDSLDEPTDPQQRELLDRWVTAFWDKDIDGLVRMFTHDAVWEMPPYVGWYAGPARIGELIDTRCPGGRHEMRLVPTSANTQPAFGLYMRDGQGRFLPFQLQVLTLSGARVSHVVAFGGDGLFASFGLPGELPATQE